MAKNRESSLCRFVLITALLAYIALALAFARTKAPAVDEGWLSSAPANWAQTGSMGTPSLAPTGSWVKSDLKGINRYTYWAMPVYLTLQGLWYKMFGVSLLAGRCFSIFFGIILLISWFLIIQKLSRNALIGALTAAFLSVDYTFLWTAADARMDMACAGFGAAGLAAFLSMKDHHWRTALWVANSLIALSVFTHPNGAIFALGLFFLVIYRDRSRIAWHDCITLAPYAVLAALWSAYIFQRPDYFIAQFGASAMVHGGMRFAGILHPLQALWEEINLHYLLHYGLGPIWGGKVPKYTLAIPFVYIITFAASWSYKPIRASRRLRSLLLLTLLFFLFMTFGIGLKLAIYLVLILPLYAAVLAVFVCTTHQQRSVLAPISLVLALVFLGCQSGTIAFKIRADDYHENYLPTVRFISKHLHRGQTVLADSYFGFNVGFSQIRDDAHLGFYSGMRPDWIVADSWYRLWWDGLFPETEPAAAKYVKALLASHYRLIYTQGSYSIYEHMPNSHGVALSATAHLGVDSVLNPR